MGGSDTVRERPVPVARSKRLHKMGQSRGLVSPQPNTEMRLLRPFLLPLPTIASRQECCRFIQTQSVTFALTSMSSLIPPGYHIPLLAVTSFAWSRWRAPTASSSRGQK